MITEDEKIRKAHEIYYRRNGMKYRSEEAQASNNGIGKILLIILVIGAIVIYQNPKEIFKINEKPKEVIQTENTVQEIIPEAEVPETSQLKENGEIIQQYEVIWPYKGEITSGFGNRVSENENINGNHTGIDIAGNYGDDIVSAINGHVIEVSEEGNLGKHIKVQNENYITVYAHCSEISKIIGDEVKQGDVIAKIGSTGNSTRKSFTF